MAAERSVGVVGAGMAGLAAAWRLVQSGHRVVLYERRGGAGGRMRSDVVDGVVVDPATQLLSSTYGTVLGLAAAVGARGLIEPSPGRDALWRDGRAHGITYGSVASMAASTALPPLLKLKLASKYLPYLVRRCRGLDANDPAGTGGASLDVESIGAWGVRELGRDFVEWMVYPFLGAYYNTTPERTTAPFYHAVARVGLDVRLLGVRGGVGRLADAVVAAIRAAGGQLRANTAVESVRIESDDAFIRLAGEEVRHDAVVLAVPAAEVGGLAPALDERLVTWLGGVVSPPTASAAIVTDGPLRRDWFGLAFPRTAPPGDRIVAACVARTKAGGLVPEDRGLLVVFPAPSVAAEWLANPDRVSASVVDALGPAFPGLAGRVRMVKVYRHTEGHTEFGPGYLRHLLTYDAAWLPPRLALAGDYLVSPTVEGAAISGERAASRLLPLLA